MNETEKDITRRIAAAMVQYMTEHRISGTRMADLMDVSYSQFKAIKNGHSGTTLRVLVRIANFLGQPIVIGRPQPGKHTDTDKHVQP